MKLKSKHKWIGVGLLFALSWVGMFYFPQIDSFGLGFVGAMTSFVLMFATVCYGVAGMLEAKVFERFFEWLKSDDV